MNFTRYGGKSISSHNDVSVIFVNVYTYISEM